MATKSFPWGFCGLIHSQVTTTACQVITITQRMHIDNLKIDSNLQEQLDLANREYLIHQLEYL